MKKASGAGLGSQFSEQHEKQALTQREINKEKNLLTSPIVELIQWSEQKSSQNFTGENEGDI